MATKKNKIVPGQLSLFDMYINQIETIQEENEIENQTLQEALNVRPSKITRGNSEEYSNTRNNEASPQNTGRYALSLFDTGSMGVKQSGETIGTGSSEFLLRSRAPNESMGGGRESDGLRGVLRHGNGRHEQMGDIQGDGSEYRALTPKNHTITSTDNLGVGGAKVKYADNMEAIKLLSTLRSQNTKYATEDEQAILAKYVGWGGLPQAFDKENSSWENEYNELLETLPQGDYVNARRSTQDAHYTSETIIKGMYGGLERLGIANTDQPLNILEPSAGIGNFIGLKPNNVGANFYTVEQDSISADILKYLYPKEHNIKESYQNTNFGSAIFDVTIGNPPFGQQKLFDKNFPQLSGFSIHNYFIAKSLDLVKEKGIGAFVVSRYFMDAQNSAHRSYIAHNSHFLGAMRLPSSAFKENALTDVTTDIVFFQKKTEEEKRLGTERGHKWQSLEEGNFHNTRTNETETGSINEYFIKFPEQILGEMQLSHGQFRDELKCVTKEGVDLASAIAKATQKLPRNVFDKNIIASLEKNTFTEQEKNIVSSDYFQSLKESSYVVVPGRNKIATKKKDDFSNDTLSYIELKNDTAYHRIAGMIQVRDTLRSLLNLEKASGVNNEVESIEKKRRQLNIQYDHFVKRFGHLNSQTNRALFREDPEASFLQSLEVQYDKGISKDLAKKTGKEYRPANAKKATIFTQRVLEYSQAATSAESALDALSISLRESGKIDFDRMSNLLDRSSDEIQKELKSASLIFQNPLTEAWEIKDKYLTGNVREKLKVAESYAENNPKYQGNVNALTEVIPKDIEPIDIGVKFGSTWIPKEDILDFINEKIGGLSRHLPQQLDYIPFLGRWEVNLNIIDSTINSELWGTPDYSAEKIIASLLMNRSITVEREIDRDPVSNKPIMAVDQDLTAAAMQKAENIQHAFSDWIWTNDERRERLAKSYNERFNTHVSPHYDGSHLELVGASSNVHLRPHQQDAVWRSIQEGTALFDHVVGAGKTLATIATIKESKRMGFLKKPMIVVPNHLVYQWRDEFYKLYPDANILVAEKADFLKENRERFFSKVATGNWDAVVVAHSSFKKIDMPHDIQEEILQEQIDAVVESLANTDRNNRDNRATVKQLEKQKERMMERFEKLMASNGERDTSVDFSDLGVDALFIDEAHEFKNLSYTTSMNVSGLGNITGSAKALDLFVKCRYLQQQNDGKGVYFLTGTPISNTIAEVYTMQRYMQFEELKAKNIEHFDAWASTFGKITSNWELDATGVNYKLKSRFANFENVPELLSMYRTFADVVTKADIDTQTKEQGLRPLTPSIKDDKPINIVVERSEDQAFYMTDIIDRMEHLPKDPRIDNPLKITNDARKAGLDYRLIDPDAEDFAGSKTNVCAENIYKIWQGSTEDRGTQLVFCDLSTPKKSANRMQEKSPSTIITDEFEQDSQDESLEVAFETEFENDIEDDIIIDMDEVITRTDNSNFSVYEDLKQKLIQKGIPENEIVFIHDANTDLRKAKLFSDMNAGNIRVLIGSTSKMGAGMNVQERLVSAHHLDAPWRPSDLEQRNGRIIRQGNKLHEKDPNFEVAIYNYATKQTYDARMWQTIEYKAAAIEQFRKGDVLQRTIDDVQSEAANAAEMKAAASGNPLILMEVNFSTEKRKFEALYAQHTRSQHRLSDRLRYLGGTEERFEKAKANYKESIKLRDSNTRTTIDKEKERIKIEVFAQGKILGAKDFPELQNIFINSRKELLRDSKANPVFGRYRGFNISMKSAGADYYKLVLETTSGKDYQSKNLIYEYTEKVSLAGLFQRLDNFLGKEFDERYQNDSNVYETEKKEIFNVQKALKVEFAQDNELKLVRENHGAVLAELRKVQDDPGYVSEWKPKTLEAFIKEHSVEKISIEKSGIVPGTLKEVLPLEQKVVGIDITKLRGFSR